MAKFTCPTCKKVFEEEESCAMPFCSKRCRLADLNGWFCEEFSIPMDIERELERRAGNLGPEDETLDLEAFDGEPKGRI